MTIATLYSPEMAAVLSKAFVQRYPHHDPTILSAFLRYNVHSLSDNTHDEILYYFEDSFMGTWDSPASFIENNIEDLMDFSLADVPWEITGEIDWDNVAENFAYSHYYYYLDVVEIHPVSGKGIVRTAAFRSL